MRFDIITIFPGIFDGFLSESLLAKAQLRRSVLPKSESRPKASGNKPIITIRTHYLRKWTSDKHQTMDGKPYGGGPGLVFKVEPVYRAVESIRSKVRKVHKAKIRVVLFSPRGKKFDQATAKRWAKLDQIIFICGRYEGVDERIAEHVADEIVSIGDYVLNGGEVAAMVVIEAVSRLLPGFMHKEESSVKEDHAQYTKPEVFCPSDKQKATSKKGWRVPKVLLSGNHKEIAVWRARQTEPRLRREAWRKKAK